jgi:hypothetical protein
MSITIDWQNKLVLSTASITDIIAHHDTLRDYEDSDEGMLHDPIISWKILDLGGGAYFYGLDYINGYQLKFPNAGNYTVVGNIGATIVPVAGVYVDRKTSAAFATVSGTGGGGATAEEIWAYAARTLTQSIPSAADIAAAILAAAQITPIKSDIKQVNSVPITGSGVPNSDEWRPA